MDYAAGADFGGLLDMCGCLPVAWVRFYFAEMVSAVLTLHGTEISEVLDFNLLEFNEQLSSIQTISNVSGSTNSNKSYMFELENIRKSRLSQLQDSDSYHLSDKGVKGGLNLTFCEVCDSQSFASDFVEDERFPVKKGLVKSKLDFSTIINNKQEFIHRDLKPQNFLLSLEGHVMLADFGFAKELLAEFKDEEESIYNQNDGIGNNIVGSLNYMAPEVFRENIYGKFIDFWALGCILYEMLTGEAAVSAQSQEELIHKLTTCSYEELIPQQLDIPDDAYDLIKQLLLPPETRLGRSFNLSSLLSHRFFTLGEQVDKIVHLENDILKTAVKSHLVTNQQYDEIPILPFSSLLINIPPPWKPIIEKDVEILLKNQQNQVFEEDLLKNKKQNSQLIMVQKYSDNEEELSISSSNEFVKSVYDLQQDQKLDKIDLNLNLESLTPPVNKMKKQTSFIGMDYASAFWEEGQDITPRQHIFEKKLTIDEDL